jgi:hypothetical protein
MEIDMLKYVRVDSDGYAWLGGEYQAKLHKSGYGVGRANEEWILYHEGKITFETTDHVLFDNYLKLLLEP